MGHAAESYADTKVLAGYYQHFPTLSEAGDCERFPRNRVRYSAKFKPLEWLNALHMRIGRSPLSTEHAVLAAYDSAAQYHGCLGTTDELTTLRSTIAAMARGLDGNPYLLGIARLLMKRILISRLNTRRTILKFYQANKPFIESRGRLRAPLIITGCPRTGSTLLQRLMAEDPNARSPFTFEMESPLPPMIEGTDPLADPRIAQANDALKVLARTAPGFLEKFSESHLWNATEYEESYIYMLGHNGLSVMDAPNAGEVFLRAFTELAYHGPVLRYERLFFTLLDAYRPASSHWILKAPNYAFAFPFVIQEYPDARVVITHRNPFISLPSVCRLLESWCIAFTRDRCFDKHRFAKLASMLFTPCFAVPFQFRRANPDKTQQIFDCMYDELFADPIGMVKRIYRFFDLDVTPGFEQRMHRYLHNNRQGKYGRHAYSLAEYAIDPEAFLENHRDYMSHYGFKLEGVVNRKRAGSLQI